LLFPFVNSRLVETLDDKSTALTQHSQVVKTITLNNVGLKTNKEQV